VEAFFNAIKSEGLEYELESVVKDGVTVMFELVGREPASLMAAKGLTTIDPTKPWKPYLLALRDNHTYKIEYPRGVAFPTPHRYVGRLEELVETVKRWEDKEGVVVFYPNYTYYNFKWWNFLVKLKSPTYVLITSKIHTPSGIAWRQIAKLALYGASDDILPYIDNMEVREFILKVEKLRDRLVSTIEEIRRRAQSKTARNTIAYTFKMRWLLEDDPIMFIARSLPRKRDQILNYLERLLRRSLRALEALNNAGMHEKRVANETA
jgi:hypothetical protein